MMSKHEIVVNVVVNVWIKIQLIECIDVVCFDGGGWCLK